MQKILLPLLFSTLCAACAETMTEFRPAHIDPALLKPVPVPVLVDETNAGVSALLVDYDLALAQANGQITAIAETLQAQRAGPR